LNNLANLLLVRAERKRGTEGLDRALDLLDRLVELNEEYAGGSPSDPVDLPSRSLVMTYVIAYHSQKTRGALMTTITASHARANLYRLLDQAASFHQPVQIKGKRASGVLISEEDWQAIQETLYLLSVPGMRESIRKGLKTPVARCSKALKW
jgi:PHD/YefM family antitoxin component YafN of YafNO toxin-antitoxin module